MKISECTNVKNNKFGIVPKFDINSLNANTNNTILSVYFTKTGEKYGNCKISENIDDIKEGSIKIIGNRITASLVKETYEITITPNDILKGLVLLSTHVSIDTLPFDSEWLPPEMILEESNCIESTFNIEPGVYDFKKDNETTISFNIVQVFDSAILFQEIDSVYSTLACNRTSFMSIENFIKSFDDYEIIKKD